jgi:hypothetical protein
VTTKGGGWHEPPYTEEEEFEFYRRYSEGMASGKATINRNRPTADEPPKQESDDGETPPVCPVAWEGRRRETSPYPDLWLFASFRIKDAFRSKQTSNVGQARGWLSRE